MAAPMEKTRYPGIYKRGSRYVIKWTDRGVQHKQSFRTLDEARKAKGARMKGETQASSNARFDDYARAWLASYQGRRGAGLSEGSRADLARSMEQRAIPFFSGAKGLRLKDIRPRDVDHYVQHLRDAGVRPPSVRKHLAALKALLATAYRDGDIAANPTQGLAYQLGSPAPGKVKVMTDEQAAQVIAGSPPEWRPFLTFLLQTGLRISEALGLTWADVQVDGRPVVRVRRQRYKGRVHAPKTPTSVRDAPLSSGHGGHAPRAPDAPGTPTGRCARLVLGAGAGGKSPVRRAGRAQPALAATAAGRQGLGLAVGGLPHVPAYVRQHPLRQGEDREAGAALARSR